MAKSMARFPGRRICVGLTAALLASCSVPTLTGTEHPDVRGLVSFNGAASSSDYSALYQKGKAHFAAGQFGLAVNEFQAALVEKPRSIEVLNALGASYDRLGRFDLADHYYNDALALDSKDPQTLNNLAYSLMLRGEPQRAIPLLNTAQHGPATDPVIAANLALAKRLEQKLDQPATASLGDEKDNAPALRQEPIKPLYIERRSEEEQELVFAGRDEAKVPAHESNPGSTALFVPLRQTSKPGTLASSEAPAPITQAIQTSDGSASLKDDSDSPTAAPLIPVARSQVGDLRPAPMMARVVDGELKQAAVPTARPPVQLVETAATGPTTEATKQTAEVSAGSSVLPLNPEPKTVKHEPETSTGSGARPVKASAEPTRDTKKQIEFASEGPPVPPTKVTTAESMVEVKKPAGETPASLFGLIGAANAEPMGTTPSNPSPPDHARSTPVEIAMTPAAALSTGAPRKAAFPGRSSACSIEISNGAGKARMASHFRAFAEAHGFNVHRVTNDRSFSHARTVAYYGAGCEVSARKLASLLPVSVAQEPASVAHNEVRLRLGHDLVSFDQRLQHRYVTRFKS